MHKKLCKGFAIGFVLAAILVNLPQASAQVTVSISPSYAYVAAGTNKIFTAQVSGSMNTAVTWSVNGIPGGNMTVGTIANWGKYDAPAGVPLGTTYTLRATSQADPAAFATATVTISNPIASVSSLYPSSIPIGPFNLMVFGGNFMNGAIVLANGAPLSTTWVSSTSVKATGVASAAGLITIKVINPSSPASPSSQTLTVAGGGNPPPPAAITVSVTPGSGSVQVGASQQFAATVANSADQTVTWKVNGTAGGAVGTGLITAGGLYTAPAVMPSPNTVTISAVAVANGTSTGTATLTIQNPEMITWGRLVDQTTFGPTPALINQAQQLGVEGFIDAQFALPESSWPADSANGDAAIDAFFGNALSGQDQLRQRVIYALSEVVVISRNKNVNGDMVIPWIKILSKNAFGNYKNILKEVTLDGGMGHFLALPSHS